MGQEMSPAAHEGRNTTPHSETDRFVWMSNSTTTGSGLLCGYVSAIFLQ